MMAMAARFFLVRGLTSQDTFELAEHCYSASQITVFVERICMTVTILWNIMCSNKATV